MRHPDPRRRLRHGAALLVVVAGSVAVGAHLAPQQRGRDVPAPTTGAAGDVTILSTPEGTIVQRPHHGPREVSHTRPWRGHRPSAGL